MINKNIKMIEGTSSNSEISSYSNRRKGFHEKYLAICKIKLLQPLPEVKVKQRNFQVLDFHADRVKVNDWLAISDALQNDRSLKYITIRLRKNDEMILENFNTLKKTKSLKSIPVIYSKFLFGIFVESIQSMLMVNSQLEVLSLEGLPFGDRYMVSLANGLCNNRSIKVLNLSRCNIGDEGCEALCSSIKHLTNIETLNLSNCNIGIKGVIALRDFIKYQKIYRFSEAWIRTLRYQNLEPTSLGGLRKIMLNNNTGIGDEGLKMLTHELSEDVWIKDIEMQDCGLTDIAANEIINCLNINKTILSFNIANNYDIPDHLHRQIMARLGNSDNESYDSSEYKNDISKVTKSQLLERINCLEEQLLAEQFGRKQAEELAVQLKDAIENQNNAIEEYKNHAQFNIPEGFTLVANDDLEKMNICGQSSITQHSASNIAVRLRRKQRKHLKKVCSYAYENPRNRLIKSRSETSLKIHKKSRKPKQFIERNIGDTIQNNLKPLNEEEENTDNEDDGSSLLKMYRKTETTTVAKFNFDAFFPKSQSHVPCNSENDSDF